MTAYSHIHTFITYIHNLAVIHHIETTRIHTHLREYTHTLHTYVTYIHIHTLHSYIHNIHTRAAYIHNIHSMTYTHTEQRDMRTYISYTHIYIGSIHT